MSLEHVKAFYNRLASDEGFRTQIQNVNSKDECSQIVQAAGYYFTQEELEEYTAELLESADAENELQDIGEKELAGVFGGATVRPMYGLPWWPWDLIKPQPLYGVVQPLYGVVSTDLE
ncbi:MAG TPA: Nif11-like leader peptide family natural product precursor [Nostocaceae cyanobacterium]|nr:Nif11-like leader peptide family natural product precursor [Nostocaceae cyanobacterium]